MLLCGEFLCDFEVNQTKIKGGCQSGRKVVTHDSKSDLPLVYSAPGLNKLRTKFKLNDGR